MKEGCERRGVNERGQFVDGPRKLQVSDFDHRINTRVLQLHEVKCDTKP